MPDEALISPRDGRAALALLTRLPVPGDHAGLVERLGASAWCWPVVGLAIGALGGLAGLAALALGLPGGLAAMLVLAVQAALTGALHEDGLADCADGFWGGATRERRLEIMRDSRLGSFGALALVLVVLGRWSALGGLQGWTLVLAAALAGALSRGAMAVVMTALPSARRGGLSDSAGRPPARATLLGLAITALLSLALARWAGVMMLLAAALATGIAAAIARARIGGQTGDVLGAVQQLAELAALAAAAALIG
ncbi:MAG: adenosylcobinamide-GDP ribazoletransferase [Alphaproteobacteria bacterium]|nr:MAG: adenosylcobinamide-GDP ribazoletransferase [Alphaproteobacteria bacterium]